MTLRDWLDKLQTFDPDDWGEFDTLRSGFTDEEMDADTEIEISFRSVGGKIEQVEITLFGDDGEAVVELEYTVFQLDMVPLAEFLQNTVFEDE